MHIPAQLAAAIDQQLEHVSTIALAKAADSLSARYRESRRDPLSEMERLAYLVTRMPATYAALHRVLRNLAVDPRTALDVGAGPGASAWAIAELFPACSVESLEQDAPFIRLGKQVMDAAGQPFDIVWRHVDVRSFAGWPERDLVVCAFSLGELDAPASQAVLRNCWQAARQALVVVEPGTPAGFARIRAFRDSLIEWGAHIAAPCPHQNACPIPDGDWCHFAQRVERTKLHRRLKAGSLSWEDEKFSYVVAARVPVDRAQARILRHPQIQTGFVQLELCTPEGLQQRTVGRRDRVHFKRARKADWGDPWEQTRNPPDAV